MASRDASRDARWSAAGFIWAMVSWATPRVDRELGRWKGMLRRCPDPELRAQGLASIRRKRFHAIGGSVYSLDPRPSDSLVALIVAYQTMSDYLDNLCDRAGLQDARAFDRLHKSMLDALVVTPSLLGMATDSHATVSEGTAAEDYYALYPLKADGGYLRSLVRECRLRVARLPGYRVTLESRAIHLARLYSDLQALKHAQVSERVPLLVEWWRRAQRCGTARGEDGTLAPDIAWWEFAAASGSTLGIFSLFNLAARHGREAARRSGPAERDVEMLCRAYFPWVCGLHILLDYLIDQEEDAREGDLNFVSFYRDAEERAERLGYFVDRALQATSCISDAAFHQGIVRGLLAMYLSDPKVARGGLDGTAAFLLSKGGPSAVKMWKACRALRRIGLL